MPSFLRRLPFRNWGYPTFAQQVIASGLLTDVVAGTLLKHARGEVELPEYWDVRRYTVPLAEGSGGGMTQHRLLYEFAAGFLRFAHVLDNAGRVSDAGGGALTFAPRHIPSRFEVQLEGDAAEYLSGRVRPEPGATRAILLDARRGHYDRVLQLASSYLDALAALPGPVEVQAVKQGRDPESTLQRARDRAVKLASEAPYFATLLRDRSATALQRSGEDLELLRAFYAEVRDFADEVLFFLRARGEMPSRLGPIAYEAASHISGYEASAERFGRVSLYVDNLFEAAEHEGFSAERRENALRVRVYAGRAMAEGALLAYRDH